MTKQQPSFKHKVTNYGVKGLAFGAMAVVGETIMAAEVLSVAVPCAYHRWDRLWHLPPRY